MRRRESRLPVLSGSPDYPPARSPLASRVAARQPSAPKVRTATDTAPCGVERPRIQGQRLASDVLGVHANRRARWASTRSVEEVTRASLGREKAARLALQCQW